MILTAYITGIPISAGIMAVLFLSDGGPFDLPMVLATLFVGLLWPLVVIALLGRLVWQVIARC